MIKTMITFEDEYVYDPYGLLPIAKKLMKERMDCEGNHEFLS